MRKLHALALMSLVAGCKSSAEVPPAEAPYVPPVLPAETCAPTPLGQARALRPCSAGSGAFGRWTLDALGLPAYDYAIDQRRDARAAYPNTAQLDRRDHWHAFGNDRLDAIFVNDGYVQLGTQDRGPTWLNAFQPEAKAYGGGFSWIDDGAARWCSAYAFRPAGSEATRRFGARYAEASSTFRGLKLTHRYHLPPGDAPVLIDDVVLENVGDSPITARHYEYWDVARRHLRGNWLASGQLDPSIPASVAAGRDAMNAWWDETPSWDATQRLLRVARAPNALGKEKLPAPDAISDLDAAPGEPWLAQLIGDTAEAWADQGAFFGDGDAKEPAAVRTRAKGTIGQARSGDGEPFAFVIASDVSLAKGASAHLRFAYGYAKQGAAPALDARWKDASAEPWALFRADAAAGESIAFTRGSDEDAWISREIAWHSAQLLGAVGYREYWGKHVVPQGSAYLWLHGLDGAPRDQALFALPVTYLRPALAREALELLMGVHDLRDDRLRYAFHGHGFLDDALIHVGPSDVYLFFLLAMTEYVEATGDASILDAQIDGWPRGPGAALSGFEHARRLARHFLDVVGTGAHGLVRVQTGDWSDGIVASNAPDRDLAIKDGESVPNTQMAAYVLPRAAKWIRARDAALADELEAKGAALQATAAKELRGGFYSRAYFGDGVPFGADAPQLEAQVWPLIGEQLDAASRETLSAAIDAKLAAPSPAGAFLFVPPADDPTNGQAWPAVTDLLAWGYARGGDTRRAWKTFRDMTLAAHAMAYPETWSGIWSAADGTCGKTGCGKPGASWSSVVTPMSDFPVMNANAHAMPLLALIRLAGVEPLPAGGGLRIAPRVDGGSFDLETTLLSLAVRPDVITGKYVPIVDGTRALVIEPGRVIASAKLDGVVVTVPTGATSIRLDLTMTKGKPIAFEVR
jgi:hypothetical protein